MKFCIISPIEGLEAYATRSNTHLVLAPLLGEHRYLEFYRRMKERGDEIILDNGTYETGEPLSEIQYVNSIQLLRPTVAVLPDYLMQDARKTLSASLRFLDRYADAGLGCQWMYVPQANPRLGSLTDITTARQEWAKSLLTFLGDPRVGEYVGWVGLPRCLATHFSGWRHEIASLIHQDRPFLKLHALGMAAGSLEEMKLLEEAGVYSIDSSAPVWRGWNGFTLHQTEEWALKGTPVDFLDIPPTLHDAEIIETNLQEVL